MRLIAPSMLVRTIFQGSGVNCYFYALKHSKARTVTYINQS